jgi:phosphatidylserine/phosphatidylglycerophosphate/cardiolipin synthase-like enzyme
MQPCSAALNRGVVDRRPGDNSRVDDVGELRPGERVMERPDLFDRWFLTAAERGNRHTVIDARRTDGRAYTLGNHVDVLIDGATYFRRLFALLSELQAGDRVFFTDWRGDRDERLDGPGTEIGVVLERLARRGVDVRGLVWRSHLDRLHFSEKENRQLVESVNEAGGEVVLDERVHRAGSHHQKIVVVQRRNKPDVAFVGGVDLSHGRHDDGAHHGDEQAADIDPRYGPHPAWHDVQLEIHGPAVSDVELTFRERWSDPTPLDHRSPWRAAIARLAHEPRRPSPLPEASPEPAPTGRHAVQLLRTYPARRPAYPFARAGERSVARAYLKAFARARELIYIEDQYLWSPEAAAALARALRSSPRLRVVAVVPRIPDRDGRVSGPPYRIGQQRAIERLREAGGDRVAVYDLEAESGWPIYVHAKVCVVDDVWMVVGSDNLNRRSWTNDSEASCAVIDEEVDTREPRDPGRQGDAARVLARETRLRLWREHAATEDDDALLDPASGFAALAERARALDAWHDGGCRGPRPPGRLRHHSPEPVPQWAAWWSRLLYATVVDPDGRPRLMRYRGRL